MFVLFHYSYCLLQVLYFVNIQFPLLVPSAWPIFTHFSLNILVFFTRFHLYFSLIFGCCVSTLDLLLLTLLLVSRVSLPWSWFLFHLFLCWALSAYVSTPSVFPPLLLWVLFFCFMLIYWKQLLHYIFLKSKTKYVFELFICSEVTFSWWLFISICVSVCFLFCFFLYLCCLLFHSSCFNERKFFLY